MIIRSTSKARNAHEMLKAAKELMNASFKLVILKSGQKVPSTVHGVKDATNDFVTFQRLAPASGDFNIGIATGSASNVIVVDVDPRNGGLQAFTELIKRLGPLPKTLISETGGGGRHYYFRPPHDGIRKKLLAPGVDLLGDGSYAVAPPSQHSSGEVYKWLNGKGPAKQEIAALPDAWREFIDADNRARSEVVAPTGDEIHEGSRNIELTRIAGHLRRSGLTEAEMLVALRGVNAARCRPPVAEVEIAKIAQHIAQNPVGAEPRDEGQKVARALLDVDFGGGSLLRHETDGRFWSWKGTHWAVMPDKILQKRILKIIETKFSSVRSMKTLVQEVFTLLQFMQAGEDDLLHFVSEPPNVVNVLNWELWLLEDGTIDVRPHNPITGMRHVLSVNY